MRFVMIVAALLVLAPKGAEAQTVREYLDWSEGRRIGYIQGWMDGLYHASAHEDVLEPYRPLPGGGSVGMPRAVPDAVFRLIQCQDSRWEYYNLMVTDIATYFASQPQDYDDPLRTNIPRFFREACSDIL